MLTRGISVGALVVAAWICAIASADPQGDPTFTFREVEDNDAFARRQILDVDQAVAETAFEGVRDCVYVNGKLQRDCVWDREPKCSLRAFGKPLQVYDEFGEPVLGQFTEEVIAVGTDGHLEGVPLDEHTVLRLGVAAVTDAFDATINGLAQNGLHQEKGEITLKVFWDAGEEVDPTTDSPDATYVFRFENGGDALRVAFKAAPGTMSADVWCVEDGGTVEVDWDIDYYEATGLRPNEPYCVTAIAGLNEDCEDTDIQLGWYDKQGFQIGGLDGQDDNGGQGVFPDLCVFSDDQGVLRFAVTGTGDRDFDGILDSVEPTLRDIVRQLLFVFDLEVEYVGGASVKDGADNEVVRLPREVWSDLSLKAGRPLDASLAHGIHGGYTLKIRHVGHRTPDDPDPGEEPPRAATGDINGDGVVDSLDLALLLSNWGSVL